MSVDLHMKALQHGGGGHHVVGLPQEEVMISGGTSGDGGGHGAGGATGAAVVVEVDAVRLLLASAVGSYRCQLVGDCLSIEQQPAQKQISSSYLPEPQYQDQV